MPFKETKYGQTHSFNDGCGEEEHNEKNDKSPSTNPPPQSEEPLTS